MLGKLRIWNVKPLFTVLGLLHITGFLSCTVDALNDTTTQEVTTTTQNSGGEVEESNSGTPTGLIVGVVVFVFVLVVSLTVSLTFGIYKYRRYHKRHGLYKQKSQVENEPGEVLHDYNIFTARSELSPVESTSP